MFHREIISEMGELGVLGPTIKGRDKFLSMLQSPMCPRKLFSLSPGFPVYTARLLSVCLKVVVALKWISPQTRASLVSPFMGAPLQLCLLGGSHWSRLGRALSSTAYLPSPNQGMAVLGSHLWPMGFWPESWSGWTVATGLP